MLKRPGFFEEIDCEAKAYFLGFLAADGHVGWNPERYAYYLEVGVQASDRDIIDKLQQALGSSHKVRDRVIDGKLYPRLHIKNKRLASSLVFHGLCPKSGELPEGVPADLLRHFYRGWFDGDGSVVQDKRGRFSVSVCGARPLVESFERYCYPLVRRHYAIFEHSESPIYYYRLGGRQGLRVLEELYAGATLWLDRKREGFDRLRAWFADRPISSDYVGVSYNKARKKYDAKVRFMGKQKHIGRFSTEVEAARARDDFIRAHGLNKRLNFLEDLSDGE